MINYLLLGALSPLALACGVAFVGWRIGRGRGLEIGLALGLGLGWIVSHLFVRGIPPFPPLDLLDWLPFIAGAATVVGVFESAWMPSLRARLCLNAALLVGTLAVLLRPMTLNTWSSRESVAQFAVIGLLITASWCNLAALSRRLDGWILGLILLAAALILSLIQAAYSGNLVLGQLGLGFAASVAGISLISSLEPPARLGLGAVAVAGSALASFCLIGQVYGNLAAVPAILVLAAPAGAWLGLVTPARTPIRFALGLLGVAVLLGAAVGLAYRAAPTEAPNTLEGFGKDFTPMRQRIVQVDAFTDRPFRGNPAAVCVVATQATGRWMQRVAAEMNLSETAFLHSEGEPGTYRLRWFTPMVEVDLCGHATLASAHVLWEEGHLHVGQPARFLTRSGTLNATHHGDWIRLDFPSVVSTAEALPEGLAEALGARPTWSGRAGDDWLIEVDSAESLLALNPDQALLKDIPARGFLVTAAGDGQNEDFVSRFFAPAVGIAEDPVTGSAHCALAPYWSAKLGKTRMTGRQISARGGVVRVELRGDRVDLEGQAVTVFAGELSDAAMIDA
ncbi:PhzF family phenazine biosynthesis protein [Isosphaeraceae bacterium EP7]